MDFECRGACWECGNYDCPWFEDYIKEREEFYGGSNDNNTNSCD